MAQGGLPANLNFQDRESSLSQSMTHQAEGPNPAKPILDFASNFAGGGLQRALGLPNNFIGRALQNPDNQTALSVITGMPFTASEMSILRQLRAKGAKGPEIAKVLDRPPLAIQNKLRNMRTAGEEVSSLPPGALAGRSAEELKKARDAGKSYGEIARDWGVSRNALIGWADRQGITGAARGTPSLPRIKSGPAPDFEAGEDFMKALRAHLNKVGQ